MELLISFSQSFCHKLWFTFLVLLVSNKLFSQASERENLVKSVYNTEQRFSEDCSKNKIKASFLRFIDDSGIVFIPHPINGKAFYTLMDDDSKDSIYLTWQPEFIEVSNDGALGFSYGPWRRKKKETDTAFYSGHYMSVWIKRGKDWKMLLDRGTRYKEPYTYKQVFYKTQDNFTNPGKATSLPDISKLDKSLQSKSILSAINEYTIFFRQGKQPFGIKTGIPEDLYQVEVWQQLNGGMSTGKDMVYEYGYYLLRNTEKARGYFVRIWKFENGNWYLRFDLKLPLSEQGA
jgi:hypothetical protein